MKWLAGSSSVIDPLHGVAVAADGYGGRNAGDSGVRKRKQPWGVEASEVVCFRALSAREKLTAQGAHPRYVERSALGWARLDKDN